MRLCGLPVEEYANGLCFQSGALSLLGDETTASTIEGVITELQQRIALT